MRSIATNAELTSIAKRTVEYAADELQMVLPEVRFFILDPMEFASLLEKQVFPTSPVNIWEGKSMQKKRHRMANGVESSLYYEVVQTGNPSYAYLNETNSVLTQASVMAHVLGHCEFSELNVLGDSDDDRTEYTMHLVRKAELARKRLGQRRYLDYWNACESMIPLIAPNSQHNLAHSIELEHRAAGQQDNDEESDGTSHSTLINPVSASLNRLFKTSPGAEFEVAERKRQQRESLSLRGYRLRAPCQDVAGFLCRHAPASDAETAILDYFYSSHQHQDFVRRTQIMNEGWAMYWEKKIMLQLFKEDRVRGVIDYAKVFSAVCYPRPWFARNPYHLGYHLWCHIERLFRTGRHSLAYREEQDREVRDQWNRPDQTDPMERMRQVVRTVTDYEFLRRFLDLELVEQFHLNRISRQHAAALGIRDEDVARADNDWIWVDPEPIKEQMLDFFTHFFQPRIYVIDNNFQDGGLLLLHRDDGRSLRNDWIKPTLHNLHLIWKGPIYLLSLGTLHSYRAGSYRQDAVEGVSFTEVCDRMREQRPPFTIEKSS